MDNWMNAKFPNLLSAIFIYYSTIMSFHQIRSRERAKYTTVTHCSVPLWLVYNYRENTDNDISLAFCVVYIICTRYFLVDRSCRVHSYQNRSQNNKIFS